jgi:hypothetical protein
MAGHERAIRFAIRGRLRGTAFSRHCGLRRRLGSHHSERFPDFAVAGKTLELTFTVSVPSLEPLKGLHPVVRATDAKRPAVRAIANASAAGKYTAALVLPEPGEWVIAVDTEYQSAATLPPLKVIAPGTPAPSPFSLTTRGFRLFTLKGCNGCHLHPEVKEGRPYGPDLTGRRLATEYLRRFLADPSITPRARTGLQQGSILLRIAVCDAELES